MKFAIFRVCDLMRKTSMTNRYEYKMLSSVGIRVFVIDDCPMFSFPEYAFIGFEINTKRTIFSSEHMFTCEFPLEIIPSSELYIDIFH